MGGPSRKKEVRGEGGEGGEKEREKEGRKEGKVTNPRQDTGMSANASGHLLICTIDILIIRH